MAEYHLSVKAVSRSTGRSAVAADAYRSGSRLVNERDGVVHDYRRRSGVEYTEIVVPIGGGRWASDRSALWNAAEAAEVRKDAKVAREYEIALPCELDAKARLLLAQEFTDYVVSRFKVAASLSIHAPSADGDERNFHAHILTTTRQVTADGLGKKTRELDVKATSSGLVEELRQVWGGLVNDALERAGAEGRVDHRSYARQGVETLPTTHLGPSATALERRGVESYRGDENRSVAASEAALRPVRAEVVRSEAQVIDLEAERAFRAQVAKSMAEMAEERARQEEATRQAAEAARQREEADRRQRERLEPLRALTPRQLDAELARLAPVGPEDVSPEARQAAQAVDEAGKARTAAVEAEARLSEAVTKGRGEVAGWREAHGMRAWLHDRGIWRDSWMDAAEAWLVRQEPVLVERREQVATAETVLHEASERYAAAAHEAVPEVEARNAWLADQRREIEAVRDEKLAGPWSLGGMASQAAQDDRDPGGYWQRAVQEGRAIRSEEQKARRADQDRDRDLDQGMEAGM